MKKHTKQLRVLVVAIVALGLCTPFQAFAASSTTNYTFGSSKDVFMTELQTSSLKSSGEEFVELYNNTGHDIDLADTAHSGQDAWKLQYFSSSKLGTLVPQSGTASAWTSPYRTISLTGTIPANDYYFLASENYEPGAIEPDQTYTSTIADSGALQLVDTATSGTTRNIEVHDRLAWSNDATLPVSTALWPAPGAGNSLQRLPNDDDEYVNSDASLTGWVVSSSLTPFNSWQAPVAPTPTQPGGGDDQGQGTTTTTNGPDAPISDTGLLSPSMTELLPNPASPQTDEIDEYIELYNPNNSAFDLNGYTLETGSTTLHDFTFTDDVLLQPHEYRAFYSAETGLSLSNSGGQARLLDPSSLLVSQSDAYGSASDGMAWAVDETNGGWHWTTALTPGASNLIITPAVVTKVTKATTTKKTTATKVKGASTTKTKKVSTTKPKKVKATASKTVASTTTAAKPAPIHAGILAAVAVAAVGYGVYEYRHDLANRFVDFRDHRAARRKARS